MSINAPIIQNAVMLDRVIGEIQEGLVANLSWLDVAFGRAQRLTKKVRGKTIITPNVFCGGWNGHGENDYIEVSPDSKIGNFAYFEVEDPESITAGPWAREISVPFSLVVWFDLRRVYGEASNRNTEYLKAQVLHVLNGRTGWHLTEGRVSVAQIYERVENIYRGYTLSEIDNQFLMHPYAGLRFTGILQFMELCFESVSPEPEPPTPPQPELKTLLIDWEIGQENENAHIQRIIGRSEIINGTIRNNITNELSSFGPNLFDRSSKLNGTWEFGGPSRMYFVNDNEHVCSDLIPIKPQRYFVNIDTGGRHEVVIKAVGPEDSGEFVFMESGILDLSNGDFDTLAIIVEREQSSILDGLCLNISDPLLDGNYYEYWREDLLLDITNIFPQGLKSCGTIFDEIAGTKAIERIGVRDYIAGDENNPSFLTDGIHTNYPLAQPRVWNIAALPADFRIAFNGYIIRHPQSENTALVIEYYND